MLLSARMTIDARLRQCPYARRDRVTPAFRSDCPEREPSDEWPEARVAEKRNELPGDRRDDGRRPGHGLGVCLQERRQRGLVVEVEPHHHQHRRRADVLALRPLAQLGAEGEGLFPTSGEHEPARVEADDERATLRELDGAHEAREGLVMAPEVLEADRRHPEMKHRVGVYCQCRLVRRERRRGVRAGNADRWKSHHRDGTDEQRQRVGSNGARHRGLAGLQVAEHRVQERDVCVGEGLVRIDRERALQVRAGLEPIGAQVQLELCPVHVHEREVGAQPLCRFQR